MEDTVLVLLVVSEDRERLEVGEEVGWHIESFARSNQVAGNYDQDIVLAEVSADSSTICSSASRNPLTNQPVYERTSKRVTSPPDAAVVVVFAVSQLSHTLLATSSPARGFTYRQQHQHTTVARKTCVKTAGIHRIPSQSRATISRLQGVVCMQFVYPISRELHRRTRFARFLKNCC